MLGKKGILKTLISNNDNDCNGTNSMVINTCVVLKICIVNEIVKALRIDTNKHLTCSCVCRGLCQIHSPTPIFLLEKR